MVMSYQVLNFSLRFFRPDLMYFFFYAIFYHFLNAIFYHFRETTLLLFNLNIFLSKI